MSCPEAKAYMSVLLSDKRVADAVIVLNDSINRQKVLIENAKISGASEKSIKSRQSLLARYEARLDAYIFSLGLKNDITKQAFLDSAKKAGTNVRQAAWLLETLDTSYDDIIESLNTGLDDTNQLSKKRLSEGIQTYITNKKYYENFFNDANKEAIKGELELLGYSANDYLLLKTFYTKDLEDIVEGASDLKNINTQSATVKGEVQNFELNKIEKPSSKEFGDGYSINIEGVVKRIKKLSPEQYSYSQEFINKFNKLRSKYGLNLKIQLTDKEYWNNLLNNAERNISHGYYMIEKYKYILETADKKNVLGYIDSVISNEFGNYITEILHNAQSKDLYNAIKKVWKNTQKYNGEKYNIEFIESSYNDFLIKTKELGIDIESIESFKYLKSFIRDVLPFRKKINIDNAYDFFDFAKKQIERHNEIIGRYSKYADSKSVGRNVAGQYSESGFSSDTNPTIRLYDTYSDRVLLHEFSHHLDRYLSPEILKETEELYERELDIYANKLFSKNGKNLGQINVPGRNSTSSRLSLQDIKDILQNKFAIEGVSQDVVDNFILNIKSSIADLDTYRYTNSSEFFAEELTDAFERGKKLNGILAKIYDILLAILGNKNQYFDNLSRMFEDGKISSEIFNYSPRQTYGIQDFSSNLKKTGITSLEQIKTLQELEDYVIQNITVLHSDESFYREVKKLFDDISAKDKANVEVKTEAKTEQEKIDYAFGGNEASLISEIIRKAKPFEEVKIDDYTGFTMRLKALGFGMIGRAEYDKVAGDLFGLLDGSKKKVTINGKDLGQKEYLVAAKILGFNNIAKRAGIDVPDISNVESESIQSQLVYYASQGQKDSFNELFDNTIKDTKLDSVDENSLLSSLTYANVDFSNGYVFFDGNKERLAGASDDILTNNETYEARYLENQIEVGEVKKADSLTELGNIIGDNKVIIVPDLNLTKWNDLLDFVKNQNEIIDTRNKALKPGTIQEQRVVIVASDIAGQNFSYGYRDGKLTVRAKDSYKFEELKNNVSAFSNKYNIVDIPDIEKQAAKDLIEENNLQNEKIYDLVNLGSANVNMEDLWKSYTSKSEDDILNDVIEYAKSVGYDVTEAKLGTNTDIERLRENNFAFSYSETLEQKFESLNNLLSHFGINKTNDVDNHFIVSSLVKMLKEEGYDIPLVGVKDLVETYIQKGEISPQFKAAFTTNNYQKLQDEGKSIDILIDEKILPKIENAPRSSVLKDVVIDRTSTQKDVIINGDSEYINSLAGIFKGSANDLSSLTSDLQTFNDEFSKILGGFDKEIRQAITDKKLKKEIDTIRFKYRQQIDILEYKFNRQYGKLFDKGELYGRKFNLIGVYADKDLGILDEIVGNMKTDIDNSISKVENKINELSKPGAFTDNGYGIVDVGGKKTVTGVDDAIIEEVKKLDNSSDFNDLRYVTRSGLEKLSTKDKVDILRYLREENIITKANASFLSRIYSGSIYLNNIDFFNTYKLVDGRYGLIPQALDEKLINLPGKKYDEVIFNKFDEDLLKSNIFERVSGLVKNNTEDIQGNLINVNEAILDEVKKFRDNFIAPKDFPVAESINYGKNFVDRVSAIMNPMFEPYAHLKPISKETIDKYKKIYQTKSGDVKGVLGEYLHKTQRFEYFESDNILSDAYKNQQKILLNRVEKNMGLIPEISKSMIYINRKIFDFYGRPIANRNERTRIVLNAQDALRTKGDKAVVGLKSVFSLAHSAIDLFIDPTIFNFTTFGFDVNRLAKIQEKVEGFINMSDLQFNNAIKNAQDNDEIISMNLAEYYRELRRRLGTDGNGKGVTTDARVNNAMHNLHKSFTEIDMKGDIKKVMNELKGYMGAIDSDNIFAGLNTQYFRNKANPEFIGDIWDDIILESSNSTVTSRTLGAETFVTASEAQIMNGKDTFNRLFGADFSTNEFSVLSQNITGVKRVSKFAGLSGYNLKKISRIIPPFVKKSLQFGQNVITSVTSVPGYINNILTGSNRHSYDELQFARDFRHIVGFGTEIVDSGTLSRWLTSGTDMGKVADDILKEKGLSLEIEIERAIGNNESSYNNFMKGDIAGGVNSVLKNVSEKVENLEKPFRSKTFETATLNGQNVSDIVMSGPLKDIAIADAIKNNGYRSFHSVPSLLATLQTVSKEEADRIIAEIRGQAVRSYNSMAGTAFGAADTPVNPYTGFKGGVVDGLFAIQDNMSYLNGWGLAVVRNFGKMLEQTMNMVVGIGGGKITIDDAVNFIRSTPEYTATLNMLKRDLVNSIRVVRMSKEDRDEGITIADVYEGLSVISTTLIGSQTVGVLRPGFASLEASLSDTGFTAKEAFFGSLFQNLFANLTVPAAALTMLENFGKIGLVETLGKMIEESGGRSAKFMAGTYSRAGEVFVPGLKEKGVPFILGGRNQDINTKTYYDIQSKARNIEIMESDSKFSKALSTIISDGRLGRFGGSLLRIGEGLFNKGKTGSYAEEALNSELEKNKFIETIQKYDIVKEFNSGQPFKIRTGDDLFVIDREIFGNNIWSNEMSLKEIVDKIDIYNTEGTILEDYSNTYDYAMEELFKIAGKDKLESIKQGAIAVDAKKSKDEKRLTRQYIEQEFQKVIDSTDEEDYALYRRVWGVMQETARDVNGVKFEGGELDKRQQKIDLYNKYMGKRTEQNRELMDGVFMQVLGNRHGKDINKELGYELYKKSDNGKYWNMDDYSSRAFVKQHLDLVDSLNRGDFNEARAQMNVIGSSFIVKNPAEALATAKAIGWGFNRIDQSPLLGEKEKIAIKVETVADNHKTVFDNLKVLEDAGYDIKDIAGDYLFTMFKLESEIDSSLANMSEDIDTGKGKGGKGGGSKFKGIKLDFGDLGKYKEKISKGLDGFRQYKLDLFKPSKVDTSRSYREKKMDSQYPLSMSAKTKTPSGFTKQDLKPRKDINRTIKKKKAKIPK